MRTPACITVLCKTQSCCAASWRRAPEDGARAGKVHDLLAHDVDAAVIRGVQLQHHIAHRAAVQLPRDGQDGGRLARAWWAVEEHVRQPVLADQSLDCAALQFSTCECEPIPCFTLHADRRNRQVTLALRTCVHDLLVRCHIIERLWTKLLHPWRVFIQRGQWLAVALHWRALHRLH